jgi:hypothetical protein
MKPLCGLILKVNETTAKRDEEITHNGNLNHFLLVVPLFSQLCIVVLSYVFGASRFDEYSDMRSNVVMRFMTRGSNESWLAKSSHIRCE